MKAWIAAGTTLAVTGGLAAWWFTRQTGVEHWRTMGRDDGESEGSSARSHGWKASPRADLALKSRMSDYVEDSDPTAAERKAFETEYNLYYDSNFKGT